MNVLRRFSHLTEYFREKKYFTIRPEKMVIKIEHAVVATRFLRIGGQKYLAASQRSMKGYLYDARDKNTKRYEKDGDGKQR